LAIGGLDPSSGAGIAADLRAMRQAGVWGCAVCSTITVQSPRGLQSAHPVSPAQLGAQLDRLLSDVRVSAIKTGALGSTKNARTVVERTSRRGDIPLIVDPVMWPSRGKQLNLSGRAAVQAIRELCAGATMLTPNLVEAEAILRTTIEDVSQAKQAAAALRELGANAVLLKGGHWADGPRAHDWLATASGVATLSRKRVDLAVEVHGTGCTLASLIAGRLAAIGAAATAADAVLLAATRWATRKLARMLRKTTTIGPGMAVLGE